MMRLSRWHDSNFYLFINCREHDLFKNGNKTFCQSSHWTCSLKFSWMEKVLFYHCVKREEGVLPEENIHACMQFSMFFRVFSWLRKGIYRVLTNCLVMSEWKLNQICLEVGLLGLEECINDWWAICSVGVFSVSEELDTNLETLEFYPNSKWDDCLNT